MKFYPYKKGDRRSLAMLNGVSKTFRSCFYIGAGSFSHTEGVGKWFPHFQRVGRRMFYPVLKGGWALKVLNPRFSHFVANPPPPSL